MKTLTIKSEKQLSALTSAIRQEIVDVLAEAEVISVAEIADILGKPADALYYHLRILEKAGLIVCAGAEREGGRCAMLYRTKAPRLRVDVERARQNGGKSLGAVVGSMLRLGTRDYRRALLLERLVTLGPQRQLVGKRKTGWLLPDQLRAVNGSIEMRARAAPLAILFVAFAANAAAQGVNTSDAVDENMPCRNASFVTYEGGKIAAADWVEYRPAEIHSVEILTQSRVVDARIAIRADATAASSSVILSLAGEQPEAPKTRNLGDGAIYWSDFLTSSVEQAIARARKLNRKATESRRPLFSAIPGAMFPSRGSRTPIGRWRTTTRSTWCSPTRMDACSRQVCPNSESP